MTARTWVYGRLTTFEPLAELIGGLTDPRVFAKKSMASSREEHLFLVYKLGNASNEQLADSEPDIERQYFQVWIHDYSDSDNADYMRIDEAARQVKAAFKLQGSPEDGIWEARYLETSQDLNDETLKTVFRYLRFQLIKREM